MWIVVVFDAGGSFIARVVGPFASMELAVAYGVTLGAGSPTWEVEQVFAP